MARAIVYIDGFNLYYGALKRTPYKWLDVGSLCALMLPQSHLIASQFPVDLQDAKGMFHKPANW